MNIFGILILIFLALLLIGIVFKLAKFVLKLVSLVFLFVFLIWLGFIIYNMSMDDSAGVTRLYVVEFNESYDAYDFSGKNYTFVDIESDEAKELVNSYDSAYLISYDTLKTNCVDNATILSCIRNVSIEQLWQKINVTE